jgi:8-amino-7-oxononanoate synthase
MYSKELKALKRANRYREVKDFSNLIDLASNDYLGLASKRKNLKRAYKLIREFKSFAPKASLLINGYHPIHQEFEEELAKANSFEAGLVVGSGFLANISLIESLVRKGDELFIDSDYHASGILATKLIDRVTFFNHNSPEDLELKLKSSSANRKIIAIEGVYSMSGEIAKREIFELANRYNALLIVDEAHSSGTIGNRLLGVFDYYNLEIKPNYIKMGTLGKAYGSYGAYILSSNEIREFLINRAKPIIYSTAPSVFDTALALVNFRYISKNYLKLKRKLNKRLELASSILERDIKTPIVTIEQESSKNVLLKQQKLLKKGIIVGAIRQPTVERPINRVILRLKVKKRYIKETLEVLKR